MQEMESYGMIKKNHAFAGCTFMKKLIPWLYGIAVTIFVIDWGAMGVKLLNGDYEIKAGAYVGLACLIVMALCAVYRVCCNRCPHCGKVLLSGGRCCAHCGKEIGM